MNLIFHLYYLKPMIPLLKYKTLFIFSHSKIIFKSPLKGFNK